MSERQARSGTTTKELTIPIRRLVAKGAISAKGRKRSTTYSATEIGRNYKTVAREIERAAA